MKKIGLQISTADGRDKVTFGGHVVEEDLTLAAKIAAVGASWAVLEANAGYLLGVLMKADPTASIALLGRFSTPTAKKQTIEAVAKATLESTDLAPLKSLLSRFEAVGKMRNDIAHGLWGRDTRRTDALAWMPASVIATLGITMPEMMVSGVDVNEILEQHMRMIEYYDAPRLDGIIAEINALASDLVGFISPLAIAAVETRYGAGDS